MNSKQFDETWPKRMDIEMLRTAISFIQWEETPEKFRIYKPEWLINRERAILDGCIEAYCKGVIRDCLCDKLKELEGMKEVKRTERGWCGHFIGGRDCRYHRNTLLEYGDKKIIVSTVGRYLPNRQDADNYFYVPNECYEMIGCDRYFETMAFAASESESGYWDADVGKQVLFDSNWKLDQPDMEKEADEMHETVVAEITHDLLNDTLRIESYYYETD